MPIVPPHQADRVMLLHDAVNEKAPKTYKSLQETNQLFPFLVDREAEMMDAWNQARWDVLIPWQRTEGASLQRQGKGLEIIQKYNRLIHRLQEETLETFTEFADMPEGDEEDFY